jgi:metal-dependent amidase/aminoacylase/carboxypeptidase family protein
VTELITDGTRKTLPGLARILGDARSFRPETEIEKQMRVIAEGTGRTYDVAVEVNYTRDFVPLLNDPFLVGEGLCGGPRTAFDHEHVATARESMTGSEDSTRFLEHLPGCCVRR